MAARKHGHVYNAIDLAGSRFGAWTVLFFAGRGKNGNLLWKCLCQCGTIKIFSAAYLRSGETNSCGCLKGKSISQKKRTHGMTGTPEYRCWRNMLNRCQLQTSTLYRHYGGRGIRVCERWRRSFKAFLDDMNRLPSPIHEIDRKDNDRHYSCGKCSECLARGWAANCRWVESAEQARNKRTNVKVEYRGKILCVAELSRQPECVVSEQSIRNRIKAGWSAELAITTRLR